MEEQQKANQLGADQVSAINQLANRVESFNEKLENQAIISPPVATKPIEDIMKSGIAEIEMTVANQPKNIIRKFQILLFPPQDAKLFYKIVFGRWLLILALMLFINCLYNWAIHQSNINKEIRLQKQENEGIGKAEYYLPPRQKRVLKNR